jgi:poly-gamma-glutamate capsule biosynthesis protein CapA/YwtB (metallophosphatase superfamily)
MAVTIALLGDVMLGRAVGERLATDPPESVWSTEVRELCLSCDLVICNLECCIAASGRPTERVPGKPFFFRAPEAGVESLRAVGVEAVGLANNHALDYGEEALLETVALLDEAEIALAGAGANEAEARRGAVVEVAGTRLGLLAASDHPREYAAGAGSPGIAYAEMDRGLPGWMTGALERLRRECGLVIAFPHWGPNMSPGPVRWQKKAAAEMRAAGASLVAGHSAHVFHGVGWSEGAPLLFDLGDCLDDYAVDPKLRNDLGVVALWRPGLAELELVGLALEFCRTRLAAGEEADWIAKRLSRACEPLGTSVERSGEGRFRLTPK